MKTTKQTKYAKQIGRATVMVAVAILSLASAMAADTPAPAERAARLETLRAEIALTRSNIVSTLEQLDLVRNSADPHAQFQRFVEQLAKMKERAKVTQERAQLMKSKGDAYFAEWEARKGVNSDAETQAKRKAAYDLIIKSMQQAKVSFVPLLDELEEIKTLLEGERSKEKVAAAKDRFMQANWHCVELQRALMTTERALDSLAAGFAGSGQGAAAEQKKP